MRLQQLNIAIVISLALVFISGAQDLHLEPAAIFLDEIIVHSADHPFVIVQNLCLRWEQKD